MADVRTLLGQDGLFALSQPGFHPREGQIAFAQAVNDALEKGEALVAEAGTGTGKTYAYLLPAVLSGKTTLISTASRALQDQLVQKDLPRIFGLLGLKGDFMALKGFANYLCLKKFREARARCQEGAELPLEGVVSASEVFCRLGELEKRYLEGLKRPGEGDELGELNSRFPPEVARQFSSERLHCLERKCPCWEICCAFNARRRAAASRVVVINHALFFSVLGIDDVFNPLKDAVILPKYRQVIFDEAHELAAEGRAHLSRAVGTRELADLARLIDEGLGRDKLEIKNELTKGLLAVQTAFENTRSFLWAKAGGRDENRSLLAYKYRGYSEGLSDAELARLQQDQDFLGLTRELYRVLKALETYCGGVCEQDEEFFGKLIKLINDLLSTLVRCMRVDEDGGDSYASAVRVGRRAFEITLTPLEISAAFGDYLRKCRAARMGAVLTSATLSTGGNFDKISLDLGIESAEARFFQTPSPFDYAAHAALYISSAASAEDEGREERILEELLPAIDKAPGGVFILTTSLKALNKFHALIRARSGLGRQVLCQYGKLSNTRMIEEFRRDGRALLLGSLSFWAGVDVPGSALSLVIIDKLPFPNPSDPIFTARSRRYDRLHGRGSFIALSVPEAVIALRQGTGRLIRHERDRGALVICDPRLEKRGYGRSFLRSLPPMARARSAAELAEFLERIGKGDNA